MADSRRGPGGRKGPRLNEALARYAARRETGWVNLAELLGDRYKLDNGDPWEILVVTDLSFQEWNNFQALRDSAQILAAANRWVLAHNGWTDADGNVLPQPGDKGRPTTVEFTYEPALEETEDGQQQPITDKQGRQLWRQVPQPPPDEDEGAFWRAIPAKLRGYLTGLSWERSQALPNLMRPPSSLTLARPTTNGAT